VLEIYHGHPAVDGGEEEEEDILEFDLDEEEARTTAKVMAIVVFYSQKSYNAKCLFTDMLHAWGIPKLALVEKLGDYIFKLEFHKEEEKEKVMQGGPWRHKGDALIIVHYDGLTRPSEVRIESIAQWVRFYDLPPAMMKEEFARQLGGQLGKFISMDTHYRGYMPIQVNYPLQKALLPEMKVKIKGCGAMMITLRYENVPHFCFSCGWIGHAAMNCKEEEPDEQSVKFSEELRASPPHRVREIAVRQVAAKVAKPLFQSSSSKGRSTEAMRGCKKRTRSNDTSRHKGRHEDDLHAQDGPGWVRT
jgi:hypothetical protein